MAILEKQKQGPTKVQGQLGWVKSDNLGQFLYFWDRKSPPPKKKVCVEGLEKAVKSSYSLVAISKDVGSVPAATGQLPKVCNAIYRGSDTSFWPPRKQGTHAVHLHTFRQNTKLIHTKCLLKGWLLFCCLHVNPHHKSKHIHQKVFYLFIFTQKHFQNKE